MMSNVWLLCPTVDVKAASHCFRRWKEAGYWTCAYIDPDADMPEHADKVVRCRKYEGYSVAINACWDAVADMADIVIAGGDDLYPCGSCDVQTLARQFLGHFGGTMGCMNLGRDHGEDWWTEHLWMGADYCRAVNQGRGPYWPEYFHFYNDHEAGLVAEMNGLLWRRFDHGQYHDHWIKRGEKPPEHLGRARELIPDMKKIFEWRREHGFPGSELRL